MRSLVWLLAVCITFSGGLPGQGQAQEPSARPSRERPTRGAESGRGDRGAAARGGMSSAGTELFETIRASDFEKVKSLVQSDKTLVTVADRDGSTALHVAADKGSKELVEFLIASGAQVDAESRRGKETPLNRAAMAGNTDAAEILIGYKADVNHRNQFGAAPLAAAAERGSTEMIQLLLKNKARVNLVNGAGSTPVEVAEANKQDAAAKLLLANAAVRGIDLLNDEHGNPAMKERFKTSITKDRDLLNVQDDHGTTPLFAAVLENDKDMVDFLLRAGADPRLKSKVGDKTPLDIAFNDSLWDIVDLLRAHGATGQPVTHAAFQAVIQNDVPRLNKLLSRDPGLISLKTKPEAGDDLFTMAEALGNVEAAAYLRTHGGRRGRGHK
jgi:ankyrin repeat protein